MRCVFSQRLILALSAFEASNPRAREPTVRRAILLSLILAVVLVWTFGYY